MLSDQVPMLLVLQSTNEVIDAATTNNKGCHQALIEGSENCLTLLDVVLFLEDAISRCLRTLYNFVA